MNLFRTAVRLRGNDGEGKQGSSRNFRPQVLPVWILLFDQSDFPGPVPFLHLFLALDRVSHIFVLLKINQRMASVLASEAFDEIVFVFPNPFNQMTGDADIQGSVPLATQDVERWMFFH